MAAAVEPERRAGVPAAAKLALAILAVYLLGLGVSVTYNDRTAREQLNDYAVQGWTTQAGQIAAAAADGIRSKDAVAVARSYAAHAGGEGDDLLRVVAFGGASDENAAHGLRPVSATSPAIR